MTGSRALRGSLRAVALSSCSLFAGAAYAGPPPAPPQATTYSGDLTPYSTNLSAFSTNLSAFSTNLSAFSTNLSAFSTNLSAFSGDVSGSSTNLSAFSTNLSAFAATDPFWGDMKAFPTGLGAGVKTAGPINFAGIKTFFDGTNTQWGAIQPAWSALTDKSSKSAQSSVADQILALQAKSEGFWGAAVRAQTGRSFYDGFAKDLYNRYGFDPRNPGSLSSVSQINRNLFILDWYDGLMGLTGTDHVDWWMKSANWSPLLTQTQGAGGSAVVGLLDFQITSAAVAQGELVSLKGVSNYSNGHGAAVASLIAAPHDGQGVMGIAPKATVIAYNPFDSSATAGWSDVVSGVNKLVQGGAGVVNLSLGVKGSTVSADWKQVFSDAKGKVTMPSTVFVLAAGNDGVAQTANVDLGKGVADNLLIVGSIDPSDRISTFSNMPGTACLTAKCDKDTRLMDRFLVAPGELVLVDDGAGGVTRRIGTSFAAPLVTGAVALLHDRWPWLADHPAVTTSILLKSARDLGATGVDPVYGAGALDVTASQSPLSFDSLKFFSPKAVLAAPPSPGGKTEDLLKAAMSQLSAVDAKTVRATTATQLTQFDTAGLYYYGFEQIGGTFRDFAIPLSSKLVGQTVLSAGGTQEQFQQYLYARLTDWMSGGSGVVHEADKKGKYRYSFAAGPAEGTPLANPLGLNLSFAAKPWASTPLGYRASQMPAQTDMRLATPSGGQALRFGYGDGAAALSQLNGLGLTSDSATGVGGANPVLGLASGGAYASYAARLSSRLSMTVGYAQKRSRLDLNQLAGADRLAMKDLADYRASAGHVSLSFAATPDLSLTGGFTRLTEPGAMLGLRSLDAGDFAGGSATDAATFGAEWRAGESLRLSASATLGSTRSAGPRSAFATAGGGLGSSAYEVAADKLGLFDDEDRLRLTVSQPLTLEDGKLAYSSVQVTDRANGEIGVVTQTIAARAPDRRVVAELLYGHALRGGAGEWGLFTRVESRSELVDRSGVQAMAGARLRLSY